MCLRLKFVLFDRLATLLAIFYAMPLWMNAMDPTCQLTLTLIAVPSLSRHAAIGIQLVNSTNIARVHQPGVIKVEYASLGA